MQEYLAVASVPVQSWGALYDPPEALRAGTVFRDLDKPFFAASGGEARPCGCAQQPGLAQQEQREAMMEEIAENGFFLDDLRLYLDTHPEDGQGLSAFRESLARREALLSAFAERFYPLTPDCMAGLCGKKQVSDTWLWQEGPMPWEGACV